MAINKLKIGNFKGIAGLTEFDIKPITLFIGPNSSGKSSCIHALAALSQTVKLGNNARAVVLDDEYAQVHLGRFIEVIHSKNYSDSMNIGIGMNCTGQINNMKKEPILEDGDNCEVLYSFKSTRRTQDVYIDSVDFDCTEKNKTLNYKYSLKQQNYSVKYDGKNTDFVALGVSNLRFRLAPNKTSGLNNEFFDCFLLSEKLNELFTSAIRDIHYLGPFRQSPLRRYPTRGSNPIEVGAAGESAITLLANEYVQSKNRPHIKEIGGWLSKIGLAKALDVSRIGKSDLFDVNVTLNDGATLPIADLGYGVSQVLPVLVQCSFAKKNSTLLFEQPELHLHPGSAQSLASVFVEVCKKKKLRIIAETHSKELFIQILRELRSGKITIDDIAVYQVSRNKGESKYERIVIEKNGNTFEVYDPWEKDLYRVE